MAESPACVYKSYVNIAGYFCKEEVGKLPKEIWGRKKRLAADGRLDYLEVLVKENVFSPPYPRL